LSFVAEVYTVEAEQLQQLLDTAVDVGKRYNVTDDPSSG